MAREENKVHHLNMFVDHNPLLVCALVTALYMISIFGKGGDNRR